LVEVFALTVIQGPETGTSLSIGAEPSGRALIGKSPICALRLTDREVSRRHASLRIERNVVVIMDLGSTNGTFVNGVSVREASLRGGETIRMGATVMTLTSGKPSVMSLVDDTSFGKLLGESRAMRALYPVLHQVASREFAVLLEGESGTGKH